MGLDAVVVGAPVGDGLFDGFRLEPLGEGAVGERGELFVGGEAEGDGLLEGEIFEVGEGVGGQESVESEALFDADDAVLQLEVVAAAFYGEDGEGERDDDGPGAEPGVVVAEVEGEPEGDSQVGEEDGDDEEVHGRIDAAVIGVVLRSCHGFLPGGNAG